jgi:septal ring factor EnvC (AmiA/AmiB activator)
MDVERTMEFILEMQAKAEERMAKHDAEMAKADARMAKADARMAKADARMAKNDRQIEALGKIVKVGMRKLGNHEKEIKDVWRSIKALSEEHRKTERSLDRFIASMSSRRSNGHKA